MAELLQIYVSSFWAWAGITIGFGLVVDAIVRLIKAVHPGKPRSPSPRPGKSE